MENIDASSDDSKERRQLVSQLRDSCEQLLDRYGKVKKVGKATTSFQRLGKFLGLRHTPPVTSSKQFGVGLVINGKKEDISISSDSEDPATSEFIKVVGEKHMNELFLRKADALMLENWGMGESVHNEETIILGTPSFGENGIETEYKNPRQATIEELAPYKTIIDVILQDHPIS